MAQDELTIDTKHDGQTVVMTLHGSLDLATSGSVRTALLKASSDGKRDLVIDLSNLEFLDSTGLGALIGAQRRALEHRAKVRLVVTDGPIARLLNITGLVHVFRVHRTLEAALSDHDEVAAPR